MPVAFHRGYTNLQPISNVWPLCTYPHNFDGCKMISPCHFNVKLWVSYSVFYFLFVKCPFISFACFFNRYDHFLDDLGVFLFIGEIKPLFTRWVSKTSPKGSSLLLLCTIVHEYPVSLPEKALHSHPCEPRCSCVTCSGQLNVSGSPRDTLGWSLKCWCFAYPLSLWHGNWHQQIMAVPSTWEPKVKMTILTTWEWRPQPFHNRICTVGQK